MTLSLHYNMIDKVDHITTVIGVIACGLWYAWVDVLSLNELKMGRCRVNANWIFSEWHHSQNLVLPSLFARSGGGLQQTITIICSRTSQSSWNRDLGYSPTSKTRVATNKYLKLPVPNADCRRHSIKQLACALKRNNNKSSRVSRPAFGRQISCFGKSI